MGVTMPQSKGRSDAFSSALGMIPIVGSVYSNFVDKKKEAAPTAVEPSGAPAALQAPAPASPEVQGGRDAMARRSLDLQPDQSHTQTLDASIQAVKTLSPDLQGQYLRPLYLAKQAAGGGGGTY
jgi:hypothetical protein